MAQFKAFATNVEVNGETVLAVVAGMGAFRNTALQILADNGIADPQAGQWYSQQAWLNAFQAIAQKVGKHTLYLIGQKIPENANFPAGIDTLAKALASIDIAYHMNHRGGEIGYYRYEQLTEHSGRMICRNPYPCDFDRGIITAMAQRFKPQGAISVRVRHDDTAECRKMGAESCTYTIEW